MPFQKRAWASDLGEIDQTIAEMQLAHEIGDAMRQAYQRTTAIERRRIALQQYHTWLIGGEAASNVIPFTAAAQ